MTDQRDDRERAGLRWSDDGPRAGGAGGPALGARSRARDGVPPPARQTVIVRTYTGRTQADASEAFAIDARRLARDGYDVVSQSWADGRSGIGRVLAIGVAALAIRPDGMLTVTYRLRPAAPAV